MTFLALVAALGAFTLFGCATDTHHLRRFGTRPTATRCERMRWAAWALLATSFALCIGARGWVFGPVLWPALVMLAAGAVFLFLNFAPERERSRR